MWPGLWAEEAVCRGSTPGPLSCPGDREIFPCLLARWQGKSQLLLNSALVFHVLFWGMLGSHQGGLGREDS